MDSAAKFTAQIISDGRVTVQNPVRRRFGLSEGDFVEVEIRPLGEVEAND